ncbi:TetR/AcrR family transcriptional regulator [Leifsonia sp. fls2-241-R2A-40a]|uniref:TetR/AcrR family transcriptional regulator n=1 Tax=Leifsonia sp. fls2-241-R2A-40a TaxID=3040290 RepID=UPI0025503B10|nr:TetR/AcrR family transcriptional regulator [Leifsonia sp. fls2-241-R2A-40a]
MSLSALLEERRPQRADARRNFDAVLAAAVTAYAELGAGVGMEEIARRAGVGVATLYRNFPTRIALMEAVYLATVDELVRFGNSIEEPDPWNALEMWLLKFADFMRTKHPIVTVLTEASVVYAPARDAIYRIADPLVERARQAGEVRLDVDADDVMRVIFAVTGGVYRDDPQLQRAVRIVLDGIQPHVPLT